MSTITEFRNGCKLGRSIANRADLAAISDSWDVDLLAVDKELSLATKHIYAADDLLTQKSAVTVLDNTERALSLKCAIAKIASDLRGGVALPPESFKSHVEAAVDPAHREAWELESANLMITLINEKEGIADILKDQGVLVWSAGEYDPADAFVRIVNVNFLTDESDIWSHVVNEPPAGKVCRFCLGKERPESFELQPLDPALRNRDSLLGGMSGKRVAILQRGVVHTHVPCRPYWENWVRIAEALEEAAA